MASIFTNSNRRLRLVILGSLILFLLKGVNVFAAAPANPNALEKTRAVLDYITNLPNRSDKRVISGQFIGYGGGYYSPLIESVFNQTGHWIGMIGVDLYRGSVNSNENPLLIDYWNKGGLITISIHPFNPVTKGGVSDTTYVNFAELITPGTSLNSVWMAELDKIAAALKELENAGVVVLWRPLHEMNGGWFWWSAYNRSSQFIELWRHMFNYFTYTKNLNNLLWVYGPNMNVGNYTTYYPGNNYVDIVGLDVYTDYIDPSHIEGYNELVALGKPFGFTEFGPRSSAEITDPNYDYARLIQGIKQYFPKTTFLQSWMSGWSIAKNLNAQGLLNDPWIVNREDLPSFTTGGGNKPPGVSITTPLNNTAYTSPANITINANASDNDGTINRVEFYQGSTRLGEDTTAPYSFTWSNAAAGSYQLTARATDNSGAMTTSSPVNISVNSTQSQQAPFWGTSIAIPGTIQAEDFDKGGEGVAYHDTTSGNTGGVYRTTDNVEIETTTDTGGAYNIGYIKAGEWLEYTVNVSVSTTYNISVRAASINTGGTFHIEFNGVDKTGPIAIPNTGGWQIWQTITKMGITLGAGEQVMRIVMDADGASGYVGNLNYITITLSSFYDLIPPAPPKGLMVY